MATFLVLAVAGAAFAYWTAGGSGTGSGSTGTTVPLVAVQTSTVSLMGPGVAPQTLSGKFNNSNAGPVQVTSVTASLTGVTTDAAGLVPAVGCTTADYTLSGAVMTAVQQVPAGTAQGAWTGATVQFNNSLLVNQDACKNAYVQIGYSII